jgi:citrate synthase
VLSLVGASDLSAPNLTAAAVAKTGARILRLLFSVVCRTSVSTPLDAALARKWMPKRIPSARAIRAALILCADHELNVSAFTARCIASAQATPYEVVVGALAAFSGRRHGGASEDIEDLFREAEETRQYRRLLARHLRKFGYIPGFGHPLYPDGDPRGRLLISLAETQGRRSAFAFADELIHAARVLTGEHPNLDFGLVTLTRAFDLPSEAPTALFALGRTIGWIAHAIEQYAASELIRPRANYVGPAPVS